MIRPDGVPAETRYRAFISYSHADDGFATWLHRRLERFVLPGDGPAAPRRLAPVFIDRAELAAGPDLSAQVKQALEASDALIVVCSPAAAKSRWVAQEIALFRDQHPDRPVLAALITGEPSASFPEPLLSHGIRAFEPLAADFRKVGDGRRLALLKVVAGLSALPLDRLVQRDAQARQRRVMAVTAATMLLSVVLASLLIVALRQRAEARRQRADAEGMVEFMLTDLRDRLKGVGRLEIMDAVNRKAMDHYAGDSLDDLPADMLERRARLLTAMGEDDYAAGQTDDAQSKFDMAFRVTNSQLQREPKNPDRIFNHAQSEYWVGYLPFISQDKARAQPHWDRYLVLAKQLVALQPDKLDWQREVASAEVNLCALALVPPVEADVAVQHCEAASTMAGNIARKDKANIQSQLDYANNIAWQADALMQTGKAQAALELRHKQHKLVSALPTAFPGDVRALQAQMQAAIGLARAYAEIGKPEEARATARAMLPVAGRLIQRDPENQRWINWRQQLERIVKDPTDSE
ncbi:toll/interleukin-1 receptor domain-containing protein [Novosphingobium sp.]|uniref:toll/interleukin-1 receptor domain-containing protein n=1 Tax=Novosphingobium sp. TaxID=1874826 RepID=UPI0025FD0829|nr:toll/interleukin-1 receptor domain-containing protein [Novosphingobium sp.]